MYSPPLPPLAGAEPGDYKKDPHRVYLASQRTIGVCMIVQYIPENPLTMESEGYKEKEMGATTGAEHIVLDGIRIDSPEAVVEHLERIVFPGLRNAIDSWTEEKEQTRVREIISNERAIQEEFGPDILKCPYAVATFPCFRYGAYGYVNYFMAYALYPDVMEKDFFLQADLALLNNRAAARAYREGDLPPFLRLDHDMADSRGMLVDIKSLDRVWFPHFARALEPMFDTDVKMIWHCDGNLMDMVPRLLEVGLHGFQGFQYEDGMDYEAICRHYYPEAEKSTATKAAKHRADIVLAPVSLQTPENLLQRRIRPNVLVEQEVVKLALVRIGQHFPGYRYHLLGRFG